MEIIIDFADIYGMREAIVTFVPYNPPDNLSTGFASQQRDNGAGIENVGQRVSPLAESRSSSSISAALRNRKSSTLAGTCANRP